MMRVRKLVNRLAAALLLAFGIGSVSTEVRAEDGYELWLRYAPLDEQGRSKLHPPIFYGDAGDTTVALAARELQRGIASLRGQTLAEADPLVTINARRPWRQPEPGRIVFDCRSASMTGEGAFRAVSREKAMVISAASPIGCLYGAYAVLRELALSRDPDTIALDERPAMPLRMLDHWDNPDGHVERGYAGRSIFEWWRLPDRLDQRMIDYARTNASIGINGVVVNNVNASPLFLTDRYLPKLKRLADAWRPYGIRLYVSARFSAPLEVGGLDTADPLDPAVWAWWQAKTDAIYAAIPDFGGFLVKASSEGQPGPGDYGRTHADGANMLAAAVGTRGKVIWRAFVYSTTDETDRVKQAYEEFRPLDGRFADNVILQVKNGPLDFQPREPFHPLFGAMPRTKLMLEAQVTREYLGQASGIVYLAPMWKEVLDADTGYGGTVARVIAPVGMAGVANIGSDRNWTGGHFDQANWYAIGRLAWDPSLSSERIAREWAALTFSRDPAFVDRIVPAMLASREAVVDYTGPLGLAHQMATGHHYGPGPWVCDLERPEWNPCYYHRANAQGIGYDRTQAGSNALGQYAPAGRARWHEPATMDERYLLWFHHLSWKHPMQSGETLWSALVGNYDRGVSQVAVAAQIWSSQQPFVDAQRFADVSAALSRQQYEAHWWRNASVSYWQSVNHLPLPPGAAPPAHPLNWYQAQTFPEAPGQ